MSGRVLTNEELHAWDSARAWRERSERHERRERVLRDLTEQQAEKLTALTALVREWGDTETGEVDDQAMYERFEAIVGKPDLIGDPGAVVEVDPYGRSANA